MSKKIYLYDEYPQLVQEWDYKRNSDLDIKKITRSSSKSVWWICPLNPKHKWQAIIGKRTHSKVGCPYCSGKKVLKEESFASKYSNILKEWDYKNNNKDPYELTENSNYRASWICKNDSSHRWKSQIYSRTKNGTGCKKCSYFNKTKRRKNNLLIDTHPNVAKQWYAKDNSGDLTKVTYGSAKVYSWQCEKDKKHIWKSSVTNRTNKDHGCPYCNGHKVHGANTLRNNRPDLAKEWHPTKNLKSGLTPDNTSRASGKKVWWQCSQSSSHIWEATVQNRNLLNSGCPDCQKKLRGLRTSGFILRSKKPLSSQYDVFASSLYNTKLLIEQEASLNKELSSVFYRMCYASIIASLEAYLSEIFYSEVISNDKNTIKLFTASTDLNKQKYSINELVTWHKNKNKLAEDYIFEIIWHNIPRAKNLFKVVLGIKLPVKNEKTILKAIATRHDIVHRNGASKSGGSTPMSKSKVLKLLFVVKAYVETIEIDLQENHERK